MMCEDLERVLLLLTQPDNAAIQKATAELKQAFKDPAVIPQLCKVMTSSTNPQVRQSAVVMLRMRVKKHWRKIPPEHRESLKVVVLQAFQQESEHVVRHSLSQLSAVMVKHETPDRWPALLTLLDQATHSQNPQDRQVGLLLLSKVVESNPEPFKAHYKQLLQLLGSVLQDTTNPPTVLYYSILTLSAVTPYTGTDELNLMRSLIPPLITALKLLIQADQDQASEAMEVLDELMESEVSIVVPHLTPIVQFCLQVSADVSLSDPLRVKALSVVALLIRLKNKAVLKQKLLEPILQVLFPILCSTPAPGTEDPEDEENVSPGDTDTENPKHFSAQVLDTMALHLPPEKLFPQLMPRTQACLSSQNPYERKGGLMCLAVLAEGCADHIRTKMLASVLRAVCSSLADDSQVVRSAGLFALGQFSEHLQPEVSQYHAEMMPLLLGYLSSLKDAKIGHVTKAFYALENFLENLGGDIQSYLPTLMETMLAALSHSTDLKLKELAVSAIGAIANAAKEMLVPYFAPVIQSLKDFLTDTREEVRSLQTQALDTLSVLARTVGQEVFSPLAAECVTLGLKLTDAVDDPDLRRCTYGLFSAVSTVSPESLHAPLPQIVTLMQLALRSTEGVTAHVEEDKQFVHLDDDDDDDDDDDEALLEEEAEGEAEVEDVAGFSVENSYVDEKEDACDALGEIAFNTGVVFQPFLQSSFEQVYDLCTFPHEDVRRAAYGALAQFCRAQHRVWQDNPTEDNHQALQKLLDVVFPCFLEAVKQERERQVVMAVLEAMNNMIKSCKEEALRPPDRLAQVSHAIRDVLKKKTLCQDGGGGGEDADDEEQQAEYDAMLQEFAGEGIPLLAGAVPAESFYPHLNELLPLIISKAKSSCTVADRSFSVGTLAEVLHALVAVPGGRGVAGKLSKRLLPVLVGGVRDSDAEVRNNSVFGLGTLAEAAGAGVAVDYPLMLSLFSNLLVKEADRRVLDNLCAALCRMIMSHTEGVPLEQVLPALLERLPLQEDVEENVTVHRCLAFLYSNKPALVVAHAPAILSAVVPVLDSRGADAETQSSILLLLQNLNQHHAQDFQTAVMSLPVEHRTKVSAALSRS